MRVFLFQREQKNVVKFGLYPLLLNGEGGELKFFLKFNRQGVLYKRGVENFKKTVIMGVEPNRPKLANIEAY